MLRRMQVFLWGTLWGALTIFSVAVADEIRYDTAGRRDPFVPLVGPNAFQANERVGADELVVEGVVYDPKGGSYAIVASEIFREGESVGGVKVVKILPDRVVFLQETKEIVVWLREEVVRRTENK